MLTFVAAIVGALLYRLRGGWLSNIARRAGIGWLVGRTQIMRAAWAVPTAALATWSIGAPWWLFPVLAVSVFAAQALFGTGQYLREAPLEFPPDLLGFYRNALAMLPAFYWAPDLFAAYAVFGALHSGLYWLGFRLSGDGNYGDVMLGAGSWVIIINL